MRNRLALSATLILAGCNFAPKHLTPDLPAPAVYPGDLGPGGGTADIVAVDWQGFFQDEQLRQLIARALDNNRDLRIAVARIDEARGIYRIERSNLFPKLGTSADTSATASVLPGSAPRRPARSRPARPCPTGSNSASIRSVSQSRPGRSTSGAASAT